jgi:hypothetical protein
MMPMILLSQAAHPLSRISGTAVYGRLPAFVLVLVDTELYGALMWFATSPLQQLSSLCCSLVLEPWR